MPMREHRQMRRGRTEVPALRPCSWPEIGSLCSTRIGRFVLNSIEINLKSFFKGSRHRLYGGLCHRMATKQFTKRPQTCQSKSFQILIKNFQNEVTKKIAPPNPSTDGMFFAGTSGRLLLSSEDRMTLFETQSRMTLAELQVPRVKYVVWSADYNHVALLSKHGTRSVYADVPLCLRLKRCPIAS